MANLSLQLVPIVTLMAILFIVYKVFSSQTDDGTTEDGQVIRQGSPREKTIVVHIHENGNQEPVRNSNWLAFLVIGALLMLMFVAWFAGKFPDLATDIVQGNVMGKNLDQADPGPQTGFAKDTAVPKPAQRAPSFSQPILLLKRYEDRKEAERLQNDYSQTLTIYLMDMPEKLTYAYIETETIDDATLLRERLMESGVLDNMLFFNVKKPWVKDLNMYCDSITRYTDNTCNCVPIKPEPLFGE